jgi:hypothetical protein
MGGGHERAIARQHMQFHGKLPDGIANAPQLQEGLILYLNAFFDLDAERQSGFNVGAIPWHAIDAYCKAHGFDEVQHEDCFFYVRRMDAAHLKRLRANG